MIELMIAVAIVAILTAIAVPAYDDSVRKARRGQVKADMAELAQRAERWHTVNNTYVGFWADVPASDKVSPRTGGTVAYVVSQNENANTFTLTATPQGAQEHRVLQLHRDATETEAEELLLQLLDT